MGGVAVLSQEHADGTKTTYRIPRWQIYGPILLFLIFALIFGLVMGLVVIPGSRRRGEEIAAANEKKFNDTVNENRKQFEIDSKRHDCIFNCPFGSCMAHCGYRNTTCVDNCHEDEKACNRNCELLYPAAL